VAEPLPNEEPDMTSTVTQPTIDATPNDLHDSQRLASRRTAWIIAGTAVVALAAATSVVGLRESHSSGATDSRAGLTSPARSDAAESAHGQGPAVAVSPVRRGAESFELVHGTAGSLRDASGLPLGR
jgi:hypothetical protein